MFYLFVFIVFLLMVIYGIIFPMSYVSDNSFAHNDNIIMEPMLLSFCTLVFLAVYYSLFLIINETKSLDVFNVSIMVLLCVVLLVYGIVSKKIIYNMFSVNVHFFKRLLMFFHLLLLFGYSCWLVFCFSFTGWASSYSGTGGDNYICLLFAVLPIFILPILMFIDDSKNSKEN